MRERLKKERELKEKQAVSSSIADRYRGISRDLHSRPKMVLILVPLSLLA